VFVDETVRNAQFEGNKKKHTNCPRHPLLAVSRTTEYLSGTVFIRITTEEYRIIIELGEDLLIASSRFQSFACLGTGALRMNLSAKGINYRLSLGQSKGKLTVAEGDM